MWQLATALACTHNDKIAARRRGMLAARTPKTSLDCPLRGLAGGNSGVVAFAVVGATATEGNGGSSTLESDKTGLGACAGG